MELLQSNQITVTTLISASSTVALLMITFLLNRFIKSYDNKLSEFTDRLEKIDCTHNIKIEELKKEVAIEMVKMNEDKYKYRLQQTEQISKISTTQNLMIETLKEIRDEQKKVRREFNK